MKLNVYVTRFPDRPNLQLQWKDPVTGRTRTKTTGIPKNRGQRGQKEAEREAAKLEESLRKGERAAPSRVAWDDARARYETEVLPGLAKSTAAKVGTVCNYVESKLRITHLHELDESRLSTFVVRLRESGVRETTVHSYLGQLKAFLNWAVKQKLLPSLPGFPVIRRKKKSTGRTPMKGRAPTEAEFQAILAAVPTVVGEDRAPEWVRLLEGLWWSGLRLGEALLLSWDQEGGLVPLLSNPKRPLLRVPAEFEKGHTDRILPIAAEFGEFLLKTPAAERKGPVFVVKGTRRREGRPQLRRISQIISQIGKAAGVKVHVDPRDPSKVKYASAHDFRRAFGERLAHRSSPVHLKEFMRHEVLETTMRYYVGSNAAKTSEIDYERYEREKRLRAADQTPPAIS